MLVTTTQKLINARLLKNTINNLNHVFTPKPRACKTLLNHYINQYRQAILCIIDNAPEEHIDTTTDWHYLDHNKDLSETRLPETEKYITTFKNKHNEYLTDAFVYYDTHEECFVAMPNNLDIEPLYDVTHWKYTDIVNTSN